MWSHRVWPQHYNGQDQNEEKVREDLTLNANNLLQKMNSYVAQAMFMNEQGLIGALPINICCDNLLSRSEDFDDDNCVIR